MAIKGDICSKMQAWNSQLLALRADLDVCILTLQNFTYFLHLCPNIQSVFAVLKKLEVEFKDRTVCGFSCTLAVLAYAT